MNKVYAVISSFSTPEGDVKNIYNVFYTKEKAQTEATRRNATGEYGWCEIEEVEIEMYKYVFIVSRLIPHGDNFIRVILRVFKHKQTAQRYLDHLEAIKRYTDGSILEWEQFEVEDE